MNLWPLLQRELREHGRRPTTYALRAVVAGGVIATCAYALLSNPQLTRTTGLPLFQGLNKLLFVLLWILGPVLTADCLSREKREGTIGLLFLTPLRPGEVVLAKVFFQALRALLVLVAATPVLMVPLLCGGVGWPDVVRMTLLHLSALGLSLAAGVCASAMSTRDATARILAVTFTVGGALLFLVLYSGVHSWMGWRPAPGASRLGSFVQVWWQGLVLWSRWFLFTGRWLSMPWGGFARGATWASVATAAWIALGSGMLVAAAGWFAGRSLSRTWRPQPLAETPAGRRKAGPFRPIPDGRNPLLRRASIEAGGWRAFAVLVGMAGFHLIWWAISDWEPWVVGTAIWTLVVAAAVWGLASFRTGSAESLELLLVSPIRSQEWVLAVQASRLALLAPAWLTLHGFIALLALPESAGEFRELPFILAALGHALMLVAASSLGIGLSRSRWPFLLRLGITLALIHLPNLLPGQPPAEWRFMRVDLDQWREFGPGRFIETFSLNVVVARAIWWLGLAVAGYWLALRAMRRR
jgi:ABC-type transport system involved in cytochrome c biogenesis permease component